VAFSPILKRATKRISDGAPNQLAPDSAESLFGVMGDYGNNVNVYSSQDFLLRHRIQANTSVQSFEFNKNGTELIFVLADQRIRFHSLTKFEGVLLRELANVHRGSVKSVDMSLNGGFMATGGDDTLIKIWDYEAPKTSPFYCQSFIGHTYSITDVIFNPSNQNQIISTANQDGIYIWSFQGDTQTNFFPQIQEQS